jgi:recombinase
MTATTNGGPAALECLATALGPGFSTTLVTEAGRPARWTVIDRRTCTGVDIYADNRGWFWWPWAERIAGTDDPLAAAPRGDHWTDQSVYQILANPKYSGHMVWGRTSSRTGRWHRMPPEQWVWTTEPTHPAIVTRDIYQTAQQITLARASQAEDPGTPGHPLARRTYELRSLIRCRICHRRMQGTTRATRTYYTCPHDASNPRHFAAYPDHPKRILVREDHLVPPSATFRHPDLRPRPGRPAAQATAPQRCRQDRPPGEKDQEAEPRNPPRRHLPARPGQRTGPHRGRRRPSHPRLAPANPRTVRRTGRRPQDLHRPASRPHRRHQRQPLPRPRPARRPADAPRTAAGSQTSHPSPPLPGIRPATALQQREEPGHHLRDHHHQHTRHRRRHPGRQRTPCPTHPLPLPTNQ